MKNKKELLELAEEYGWLYVSSNYTLSEEFKEEFKYKLEEIKNEQKREELDKKTQIYLLK